MLLDLDNYGTSGGDTFNSGATVIYPEYFSSLSPRFASLGLYVRVEPRQIVLSVEFRSDCYQESTGRDLLGWVEFIAIAMARDLSLSLASSDFTGLVCSSYGTRGW